MILKYVADSRTARQLLRRIVHPALEAIKSDLDQTVSEILAPHQAGHPITYNHYFNDNIQKLRQKRRRALLSKKLDQFFGTNIDKGRTHSQERAFDIESLLNNLMESSMRDMDRFACSEAIDGMMAYYKVAMKTLVDEIAVLAIEKCLMKNIPELLSSRIVISLDDDKVSAIAAESDEARAERTRAENEHKVLTKARAMLNRLSQSHPSEVSELDDLAVSTFPIGSDVDGAFNARDTSPGPSVSVASNSRRGSLNEAPLEPNMVGSPPTNDSKMTMFGSYTFGSVAPEPFEDWGTPASEKKKKKNKKLNSFF